MENQEKKEKLEARLEVVRFDNEDVIAASGQPRGNRSESNSRYIQMGPGGNDFTFGSFPTKQ